MDASDRFTVPPTAVAATAPETASPLARRLAGAAIAVAAATVLGIAAFLAPAGVGLGTHEQLGLPRCGWITIMDMPCPTCGMTTSFAHAADGNLIASFRAQPIGLALALVTAMALIVGGYVALTGASVSVWLRRLWGPWTGWMIAGAVLLGWAWKILSYRGWM